MTHESSGSGRSLQIYGILNFTQKCQKDAGSTGQQFQRISGPNISATIHPINMIRRSFWISFVSSLHWLRLIHEVSKKPLLRTFSSVKCLCLRHPHRHTNKSRKFSKSHNPNFDLYVIRFICTSFEAFTTFSAFFTRIRRTVCI